LSDILRLAAALELLHTATLIHDDIIDDAINRRMPLGLGGLPLADMVDALPAHLPMAIEERSAALRDAFPDLNERARECARTSRAWLDSRGLDARA
jgi:hypothetical protein